MSRRARVRENVPVYKRCPECEKDLEARRFYKDSTQQDGLASWCKSCMNCGVVRDRKVYLSAERQLGDPSECQIKAACLAIQSSWPPSVMDSRKVVRWNVCIEQTEKGH